MKSHWYKLFYSILAACFIISSGSLLADHGWHEGWHGGGWHHHHGGFSILIGAPAYYPAYYSDCVWVRGHFDYYGNWIPPHRDCW